MSTWPPQMIAMVSDDATREGAHEQTAQGGRTTPPRPATPTWQTVVSLVEKSPAAKSA